MTDPERFLFPLFPSAKAIVSAPILNRALALTVGVEGVFVDDDSAIYVPESRRDVIEALRTQCEALVEYGCGETYEYATLAREAGVDEHLVVLGHAAADLTGNTAEEMVRLALDAPDSARNQWRALYDSHFSAA